jgi:pyruvate carboxylase
MWKEERGGAVNLVVFQDSDLREMALHEWLDLRQDRVFVISDREAEGDLDERALLGRGYAGVSVYSNYIGNGAIDADVLDLHARFGIDRIVAMGEDDVIRAARLRAALNLPGQSLESAVAYRDKVVMKALLRGAGIPVTPFRALGSPMDLIEFEREYPLPLFIKPVSSSGGTGVRALRTRAELRTFLETAFIGRFPGSE